jgi:hypothetical protein
LMYFTYMYEDRKLKPVEIIFKMGDGIHCNQVVL